MKVRSALLVTTLLITLPAGADAGSTPALPVEARAALEAARAPAERLIREVHAGGFLQRTLAITRHRVEVPARVVPGPEDLRAVSTLRGEAAVAVAELHAAVGAARSTFPVVERFEDADVESLTATSARAALLVAAALDRAIPVLREAPPSERAGTAATGCDLIDALPNLCVGSDADNTYTAEAGLLIDLGGDDTYATTAAGATVFPYVRAAFGVGVNVDLAGNDHYIARGSEWGDAFLAHGTGFGGTGILVDAEGDDRYDVVVYPDRQSLVYVQASAGYGGFGAMFDLGGDDRYAIESLSRPSHGSKLAVFGQAFAATGNAGLFDGGGGEDSYRIAFGRQQQKVEFNSLELTATGQGTAGLGVAVLADDGGAGSFLIEGTVEWQPQGVPQSPFPRAHPDYSDVRPFMHVSGQGVAELGGVGVLLSGAGDTSYTISARGEGVAHASVFGQGGANIGLGLLRDAGGNDSYTANAVVEYRHTVVIDDESCQDAEGTVCPFAEHVEDQVLGMDADLWAQGSGRGVDGGDAWGVLEDLAGDDQYDAAAGIDLSVELLDGLSAPASPPSLHVHSPGHGHLEFLGQGASTGPAAGILVDSGGTDSYTARFVKQTAARATSAAAEGVPDVRAWTWGGHGVAGQGAAWGSSTVGALLDLGGSGDRFIASSTTSASTEPDTGRSVQMRGPWPRFQGGGDSKLDGALFSGAHLAALGTSPEIVSSPSQVVCPGSSPRGFGVWQECHGIETADAEHEAVDFYGMGSGSSTAEGGTPSLDATSGVPSSVSAGSAFFDYGAVLRDATGVAIPGARIHFDLQHRLASMAPFEPWRSFTGAEAVTGADGVARARISLDGAGQIANSERAWRVLLTFDGGGGLIPRHSARAMDIVM